MLVFETDFELFKRVFMEYRFAQLIPGKKRLYIGLFFTIVRILLFRNAAPWTWVFCLFSLLSGILRLGSGPPRALKKSVKKDFFKLLKVCNSSPAITL